jgi:uncharacterized integral membrane protein
MRGVKRVAAVVAVLVVALVVLVFVLENQQGTSLSFFGSSTGQMPVSVFVVIALFIGMLIGPFLGALTRIRRPKPVPVRRS